MYVEEFFWILEHKISQTTSDERSVCVIPYLDLKIQTVVAQAKRHMKTNRYLYKAKLSLTLPPPVSHPQHVATILMEWQLPCQGSELHQIQAIGWATCTFHLERTADFSWHDSFLSSPPHMVLIKALIGKVLWLMLQRK